MASIAAVGMYAGLAGSAASAVGTIASGRASAASSSAAGLVSQFQGNSQALQSQLGAGQATLAGKIARSRGRLSAAQAIFAGETGAQITELNADLAEAFAELEGKQLDVAAGEELAAGQRDMFEFRRQTDDALSTSQARAAASGFTATDPTALKVAGDVANYGRLQERMALYSGQSRADALKRQAATTRLGGFITGKVGDIEAKSLRSSAKVEALSFRNAGKLEQLARLAEAENLRFQAPLQRKTGRAARSAGNAGASAARGASYLGAAGTLAGGVSKFAAKYG